jgi:hypothetical protein
MLKRAVAITFLALTLFSVANRIQAIEPAPECWPCDEPPASVR